MAAIRVNGKTYTAPNHALAIEKAQAAGEKISIDTVADAWSRGYKEGGLDLADQMAGDGFVTNTGRYVSRFEADTLAREAGIISREVPGTLDANHLPPQAHEAGRFDFSPGQPRSVEIGPTNLKYLPEDGTVELTALGTPEAYRGQGAATQAMQQFTGALDEAGLPSRLVARGDAGSDPALLQSFYASHGYGPPGPDGYMVRPAKPTGETLFSNPKDVSPAGILTTGDSNEHHARTQPRNPSGQFVTSDSFDGKLHAFGKVLVDLDGDGKPDAVSPPTNAMAAMRGNR
jgi:GNAT superfamily N-acetyltransferase